jgi:hypothetical protein
MIWNLSEREYNYKHFDNRILDFPFPDHHPPPLDLMFTVGRVERAEALRRRLTPPRVRTLSARARASAG